MGEEIPKINPRIDFYLFAPSSNSLEWFRWQREVNSVLEEINLETNPDKKNSLVLYPHCDGIYDLIPINCKVKEENGYKIKKQFLMQTSEKRLEEKTELLTQGFALPIKINLYHSEDKYPHQELIKRFLKE